MYRRKSCWHVTMDLRCTIHASMLVVGIIHVIPWQHILIVSVWLHRVGVHISHVSLLSFGPTFLAIPSDWSYVHTSDSYIFFSCDSCDGACLIQNKMMRWSAGAEVSEVKACVIFTGYADGQTDPCSWFLERWSRWNSKYRRGCFAVVYPSEHGCGGRIPIWRHNDGFILRLWWQTWPRTSHDMVTNPSRDAKPPTTYKAQRGRAYADLELRHR
jgi:hypothetical protein